MLRVTMSTRIKLKIVFSGISIIALFAAACGGIDDFTDQSLLNDEEKADTTTKEDDPLQIKKAYAYYTHRVSDDELWIERWPNKDWTNEIKKQSGDITENLWRGSQPDPTGKKFIGYDILAEHGINSIISLREAGLPLSSKNYDESRFIDEFNKNEQHSRKLIAKQIPVLDGHHPTLDDAMEFINFLIEEKEDGSPKNLPAYVHCHLGQGRAGTFVAIYRMVFNNMAQVKDWNEFKNSKGKFTIKALTSNDQYQVDQAIDEARSHGMTRCGQLQFLLGFGEALNQGQIQYDQNTSKWRYTDEAKNIINEKKDIATMYKFSDGENCKEVTKSPKENRDPLL